MVGPNFNCHNCSCRSLTPSGGAFLSSMFRLSNCGERSLSSSVNDRPDVSGKVPTVGLLEVLRLAKFHGSKFTEDLDLPLEYLESLPETPEGLRLTMASEPSFSGRYWKPPED